MSLKEVFSFSITKLFLTIGIVFYYLYAGDPFFYFLTSKLSPSIGLGVVLLILDVLYAYFISSIFIFEIKRLFKHIKHLKTYSDVFKFKNSKYPLLIALILAGIILSLAIYFQTNIPEALVFSLIIFIPVVIATIYYWKKDLFVERYTWFFFLFSLIGMFLTTSINLISMINETYFHLNVLPNISSFILLVIAFSVGGFITGGLIYLARNFKNIFEKRWFLFEIIIVLMFFLWIISNIGP